MLRCSQCKMPYCGQHRLPEIHNCIFLEQFRSDNRQHREKWIQHRAEVQSSTFNSGQTTFSRGTQTYLFSGNMNTWTTGRLSLDFVVVATIISISAILSLFRQNFSLVAIALIFPLTFITCLAGLYGLNWFRTYLAQKYLLSNQFIISKFLLLFSVLSLILTFFVGFSFLLLPGFFLLYNNYSHKTLQMVVNSAIGIIIGALLVGIGIPYLLAIGFQNIETIPEIIFAISFGLNLVARSLLLIGIITFISEARIAYDLNKARIIVVGIAYFIAVILLLVIQVVPAA